MVSCQCSVSTDLATLSSQSPIFSGTQNGKEGMLSAFLFQESNHDVVVDYTVSVEGGDEKSGEMRKL